MRIVVYGQPAPQGSKRGFINKWTKRVVLVESSDKVKPWREAVKMEALQMRNGPPIDGPISVSMVFTFNRPQGHYRTGKNANLLRDSAPKRPSGTPDLSKLIRSTEDALTDAGVWKDDARVVEYTRVAKVYVDEDADALRSPGVVIVVTPLVSGD
jgi:Holliday junction resolvase RusA-like endonuclease